MGPSLPPPATALQSQPPRQLGQVLGCAGAGYRLGREPGGRGPAPASPQDRGPSKGGRSRASCLTLSPRAWVGGGGGERRVEIRDRAGSGPKALSSDLESRGPRRGPGRRGPPAPRTLAAPLAQLCREETFRAASRCRRPPPQSSLGAAPSPDELSGCTGRPRKRVGTSNCFAGHPVTVATPSGGARRSNPRPRPLSSRSQGGDPDEAGDGEGAAGPRLTRRGARHSPAHRGGAASGSRRRAGGSGSGSRGGEGG